MVLGICTHIIRALHSVGLFVHIVLGLYTWCWDSIHIVLAHSVHTILGLSTYCIGNPTKTSITKAVACTVFSAYILCRVAYVVVAVGFLSCCLSGSIDYTVCLTPDISVCVRHLFCKHDERMLYLRALSQSLHYVHC